MAELRQIVRAGMEQDPGFEVVGEAGDGRSAIAAVAEANPQAVILDLSMPDMDGLQAIPEIRDAVPDAAIVVLSGFSTDRMVRHVRSRGADDYVEKGTADRKSTRLNSSHANISYAVF